MKIKIVLLTILLSVFGSTALAQSSPASTKAVVGIRGVDFLNYSYRGSACGEDAGLPETVKVRNGRFTDRDKNFFTVSRKEIVYGDVNGDGTEDAVLMIRCGTAASSTFRPFEVHAYAFQDGQAKLLARLDNPGIESDYKTTNPDGMLMYPGENGPKILNGHVMVEALTDGSMAGPENVATFDYQLSGDKFVLNGKPTMKKRQSSN